MMTMQNDECLDLVDADDVVIGKMPRSEAYAKGLRNFRAVNSFLVNSRGEIWIPTRTPDKLIFPNALDMSVAGHVTSGEDYETSFRREVAEEINLDLDTVPWKLLAKLTPAAHGVAVFEYFYRIDNDATPDYNPDDFVGAEWMRPEILLQKLEAGEVLAKSDLIILVRLYLENNWGR